MNTDQKLTIAQDAMEQFLHFLDHYQRPNFDDWEAECAHEDEEENRVVNLLRTALETIKN